MKNRKCRDCGDLFDKKIKKYGFSDQCDDCSTEVVQKYLGYNDGSLNKSTHTSIYRGESEAIRKRISNQKSRVG